MDTEKKEIVEKKVYEAVRKSMLPRAWPERRWASVLPEQLWACGVHPVEADWESVEECLKT